MSASNDNVGNTVKTGTKGLIIGLLLGVILPPISWIAAFIIHNNYRKDNNISEAKGVKTGAIISGIMAAAVGTLLFVLLGTMAVAMTQSEDFQRGFQRGVADGQARSCEKNLIKIAGALEMWAADHNGRYPGSLYELNADSNGRYLKHIPLCRAAGTASYVYTRTDDPAAFTVYCKGKHHEKAGYSENRPAYNSQTGLIK